MRKVRRINEKNFHIIEKSFIINEKKKGLRGGVIPASLPFKANRRSQLQIFLIYPPSPPSSLFGF
jgi:hypothetical protein